MSTSQVDYDVLELLVRQQMAVQTSAFVLSGEGNFAMLATYFLLDKYSQADSELFITQTLGRLLTQLTRSTQRQVAMYEGEVRGRIFWPATYKARHSQDFNPTRFACREVNRRYDTPENQLLKYMMVAMEACLRVVPAFIRQGVGYSAESVEGLGQRLARMETSLQRWWRNVRLQEIEMPAQINENHLLQASTASLAEYHTLVHLYRHYHALVLHPSWSSLWQVGERILILPAHTGTAENQWIEFGAKLLCGQKGGKK